MTDIAALVSDHLDIWTAATERKNGAGRGGGRRVSLYGIERLRALILDFAVRGKLVSQDDDEGEAAGLLADIKKGKAALIAAGSIKKPRELEVGLEIQPLFDIPPSWHWVRLDKVGAIIGGGTPPSSVSSSFVEGGAGIPWLTPADLGGFTGRYVAHGERDLSEQGLRASSATVMPKGTVLFTSRAPIGYVAIAENALATNQGFKSVVPYVPNCNLYIAIALKAFAKRINDEAPGTTFKEVSGKAMAALPFPLPPLAEQQRIVAKVDELMALCDALEGESAAALAAHLTLVETLLATLVNSADPADLAANWSRLEAHFDTLFTTEASVDALRQAILELAVSGRLMPHDNAGWPVVALKQVIGPMDSGWSPACHEYAAGNEETWGVLKTTAVQRLCYDESQNKALPLGLEPRPSAECRAGDILITRAGPMNRVGICCHVAETRRRLMISDKIIRFRPASEEVDGAFLALALSVGPAANQIEVAKSGMAASQVNISQAKLKSVMVAVPPLPTQQEVVRRVHELMRFCDKLQNNIVDARQTQIRLADAIVERVAA